MQTRRSAPKALRSKTDAQNRKGRGATRPIQNTSDGANTKSNGELGLAFLDAMFGKVRK